MVEILPAVAWSLEMDKSLTRYGLLAVLALGAAVVLDGCVGATSVVNTEIKQDQVSPMTSIVIVTNLNLLINADLFDAFSSQLQREMQNRGVSTAMLVLPPPESVADKPDIKGTVAKTHATHVLSLLNGRWDEMVGGLGTRTGG
jgi:hypothetical protein